MKPQLTLRNHSLGTLDNLKEVQETQKESLPRFPQEQ